MYELQIFISQRLRRIPSETSEFFISCEVRDLTDGDITLCDNKRFKQNFIKGIIFVFREICFHRADNQVKLSIINWFISNDKKCDKFKTLSKSCEFDCQFQDKNVLSLFSILSNSNKDPVLYFYIDHKIQT